MLNTICLTILFWSVHFTGKKIKLKKLPTTHTFKMFCPFSFLYCDHFLFSFNKHPFPQDRQVLERYYIYIRIIVEVIELRHLSTAESRDF